MRQCAVLRVRWPKFIGGTKEIDVSFDKPKLPIDVKQETGQPQPDSTGFAETERLEGIDKYRARGFLKHVKPYQPPADLENQLAEIVSECSPQIKQSADEWQKLSFGDDVNLKFQILTKVEKCFGKIIPNSYLHEMKTMEDVLKYYQVGVSVVAAYNRMARNREQFPPNVQIGEECIRYDPERDGETAYPKRDQRQFNPRFKALYKEFRAKREWHEFQEKHVRHDSRPDDAPWQSGVSDKLDTTPAKGWFRKKKTWGVF